MMTQMTMMMMMMMMMMMTKMFWHVASVYLRLKSGLAASVKARVTIPSDTWITCTKMPIHKRRNEKHETHKNASETIHKYENTKIQIS